MIKVLNYTKNPLTLMGTAASSCWNSKPSAKIGIECIENNHGRILEFPDVTVEISNYSARVIREIYTHIVGTSRVQASTRYIKYGEFDYIIPETIANHNSALGVYCEAMNTIQEAYQKLEGYGIPKEDIANILPLGMESKMVLKINARALLHMAEVRLCSRAYWEFRNFMNELLNEISKLDDEWAKIVTYAKPKCEICGYCNEKFSCGKYPKKEMCNG